MKGMRSATALSRIRELANSLNRRDMQAIIDELSAIVDGQPAPTPAESALAPGHYFEERQVTTGKASHTYLYERWYERDGCKLKHKGKMIYKGTLAEYIKSTGRNNDQGNQ